MIELQGLTKRYGDKLAVDDLSFTVQPGIVTGFLGPNGAGKSTTMRMILGLDRPTSGSVLINGKRYVDFPAPLREVGALLEARSIHTGRKAYAHLLALAATHGISAKRVEEVIDIVGLREVAHKRAGGFSLGMGQRLGLAAALLGDPAIVMLDEPVNGLDPQGVLWVRQMLRHLASVEGRTVFVSSHLLSEMAQTADRLVVIGKGKLIADASVADVIAQATGRAVRVRSPQADQLATLIESAGGVVSARTADVLTVTDLDNERIGHLAADNRIVLVELTPVQASLEEAFMELTEQSVEYQSGSTAGSINGAGGSA